MSAAGLRRNIIYGWTARINRAGERTGRWHAHTAFGRPLCPTTSQRGNWRHITQEERPAQEETCKGCWALPDDGVPA